MRARHQGKRKPTADENMSEGSFPRKAEGGGGSGGFQSLRESRAKRQLGRDLTGVSRLKQGLEVGIQDQGEPFRSLFLA